MNVFVKDDSTGRRVGVTLTVNITVSTSSTIVFLQTYTPVVVLLKDLTKVSAYTYSVLLLSHTHFDDVHG